MWWRCDKFAALVLASCVNSPTLGELDPYQRRVRSKGQKARNRKHRNQK